MTGARIEHSSLGIASFVLSFFPAVLLAGAYWLTLLAISKQPPGADTVGYAFGMFVITVLTVLSEIAAFGLGIAGALQRRRKRLFGILGVACSVLVLAVINAQVGYVDLAKLIAGFVEGPPEVHSVSPQND